MSAIGSSEYSNTMSAIGSSDWSHDMNATGSGQCRTPRVRSRAVLLATALLLAVVLVLPEPAWAQSLGGAFDTSLTAMQNRLFVLGAALGERARQLLLYLLVLDLVWRGARWVMNEEKASGLLEGWAFSLGFVVIIYGLTAIMPDVIEMLAKGASGLSSAAGGAEARPGAIIASGFDRILAWLDEIAFLAPGTWFYLFTCAISIIVMAVSLAMLIGAYAELYVAGLAGIIALGFAGLEQTKSIATSYLMTLLGKAMKLFGIMVILAVAAELTTAVLETDTDWLGFEGAMTSILLQIVAGFMILTLPQALESMVSGARLSSGMGEAAGKTIASVGMGGVKMAGGAALGAGKVVVAGAAGAVVKGTAGALAGMKGGGGIGGAVRGGLRGTRQGALDWGGAARRGEVMKNVGRMIRRRRGGDE